MTKREVSRFLLGALTCLTIGLGVAQDAWAAAEKGPRCSDGVDNDGDGLIDGDDPDCGGDGGGGGSQVKTPARITFDDSQTGIRSDGGSYEGFDNPNGLEVFIGSQGNYGNIYFRTNSITPPSPRALNMTLPANTCGLPTSATTYYFHFANAKPDEEVPDGLFGFEAGGPAFNAPMRIRFFHGGTAYFLNFDAGDKGPCKSQSDFVKVERLSETEWRVFTAGQFACVERHNEKGKNDLCGTGPMSFSYIIEDISTP